MWTLSDTQILITQSALTTGLLGVWGGGAGGGRRVGLDISSSKSSMIVWHRGGKTEGTGVVDAKNTTLFDSSFGGVICWWWKSKHSQHPVIKYSDSFSFFPPLHMSGPAFFYRFLKFYVHKRDANANTIIIFFSDILDAFNVIILIYKTKKYTKIYKLPTKSTTFVLLVQLYYYLFFNL